MTTVEALESMGFIVSLNGAKVRVFPSDRITNEIRDFIMLNRMLLIAELSADDGKERRMSWQVLRDGKPIATIAGVPMTREEALASARFRWTDAEVRS